jgi:hypothetical protein
MLGNFLSRVKGIAQKALGATGTVLRKIGSFAVQHHQPISALVNAATSSSENPYVKALGSAAVLGSALATRAGVGKNYSNSPPFNQAPQ